jgi:hypothetical protein
MSPNKQTESLQEEDIIDGLVLEVAGVEESQPTENDEPSVELLLEQTRLDAQAAESMNDEKQARILRKTEQWLGELQRQAFKLTQIATALYERCIDASGSLVENIREEQIEQLEWLLVGLEQWVESEKPRSPATPSVPLFHVRWGGNDGIGFWTRGKTETEHISLRLVLAELADTEALSPPMGARVVDQILEDLRTGELETLRLVRRYEHSTPQETVFELQPRGTQHAEGKHPDLAASVALASEYTAIHGTTLSAIRSR